MDLGTMVRELGTGMLITTEIFVLTLVFSVLAVTSRIDGGQFLNIFSIVCIVHPDSTLIVRMEDIYKEVFC